VVLLDGAAFNSPNLVNIVHDLALMHVLGARLVLIHGSRPQLDAALPDSLFHHGRRVTRAADLPKVLGVFGEQRVTLKALFSGGLPSSPLRRSDIAVMSGNFITAQPVGIIDGTDHELTGKTRRVHIRRINAVLDAGALALMSPLGYSPSGQVFNMASDELATDVAVALGADKLVIFNHADALRDAAGQRLSVLSPADLDAFLGDPDDMDKNHLRCAVRACRGGIQDVHLVGYAKDGALLAELFTAEGSGTQITESNHELIRPATLDDVASIVDMIRPLEERGILVRRSRDRLEAEISHFLVADIDSNVVGCCAIYPYEDTAELACVAVHPSYRDYDYPAIGPALLEAGERHARAAGAKTLFALTTQTHDWFVEHGFKDRGIDALPAPKQALYNYQRNAHVLTKSLDSTHDR